MCVCIYIYIYIYIYILKRSQIKHINLKQKTLGFILLKNLSGSAFVVKQGLRLKIYFLIF